MMRANRRLSLKAKLIWLFFILWCVPILILFSIWYFQVNKTIENNAIQANKRYIEKLNDHIDFYFYTIKKDTLPVLVHPLVQDLIRLDPANLYEHSRISSQMTKTLSPNPLYIMKEIIGFHIIGFNGLNYSNMTIDDRLEWFKNVKFEGENFYIQGVSELNGVPVITVYRQIINRTNYKTSGVMVLDISLEYIRRIMNESGYEDMGRLMITDRNGRYVLHPDQAMIGQFMNATHVQHITGDKGDFIYNGEGTESIIAVFNKSSSTGLTVLYEVPVHVLTKPLFRLRYLTIVILSVLLTLTVIAIYALYRMAIKPLFALLRVMRKVGRGELDARAPERNDEIGIIHHGFNQMVDQINLLIEFLKKSRQKESELRLQHKVATLQSLQARINPHFLYNSLEIINAYALQARLMPVSKITVHLAKIFRYSVSEFDQAISLQLEMEHVANYLAIQQERFKALRIERSYLEEDLVQVKAFKLVVQPIIENSFIHGYEKHQLKPSFLGIYGTRQAKCYILTITDRGHGMDSQLMDSYNEAFRSVTEEQFMEKNMDRLGRIGLWNVHTRLRLAFGQPYGLQILSSGPSGTEIQISFPYFAEKGMEQDESINR